MYGISFILLVHGIDKHVLRKKTCRICKTNRHILHVLAKNLKIAKNNKIG